MKRKTRTLCLILSMGIAFVSGVTATVVSDPLNLWLGKPGGYWESKETETPKENTETVTKTPGTSVSNGLTELVQNIVFDWETSRTNLDSEFIREELFDSQSSSISNQADNEKKEQLTEIENPTQSTETSVTNPSKSSDLETDVELPNKNTEDGNPSETGTSESNTPLKNNGTGSDIKQPSGSFNPEDNPNRTITYDPPRAGDGLFSDKPTALEQTEIEWNGKSYPMVIWTNPF